MVWLGSKRKSPEEMKIADHREIYLVGSHFPVGKTSNEYIHRILSIPLRGFLPLFNVKKRSKDNKAMRTAVLRMDSRRKGYLMAFTFSLVFEFHSVFTVFSHITWIIKREEKQQIYQGKRNWCLFVISAFYNTFLLWRAEGVSTHKNWTMR